MIFTPFKSLAVLAATMFVAPAAAQLDTVTGLVCGVLGKANFLTSLELIAAVKCLTKLEGCDSVDLPEAARTDLSAADLGILKVLLDQGVLDSVLNGQIIDGLPLDLDILTNLLGDGNILQGLLDQGLLDGLLDGLGLGGLVGGILDGPDGLIANLDDVLDEVLDLVRDLLANLLGYYGDDLSSWCTGLLTDLDGVFAGLTEFNLPLINWNVAGVKSFVGTFKDAALFNQDITGWDMKNACDLTSMLEGATSFNQNLNLWLPDLSETLCSVTPVVDDLLTGTACEVTVDPILPSGPICQLVDDVSTPGGPVVDVKVTKCLKRAFRAAGCKCSKINRCVNQIRRACGGQARSIGTPRKILRSKAVSMVTNKCK
ncbi:hypothetical protein MPSEU_000624100 [Mayamaea pseudoterrestris]|nr:hypothetical protein MPSEU_000624100 [Mayamaea pseudoterrestris]